ncbi:nicotinamide riboside transporter PnuC [Blattabacterium cuenoti]|uniref:nicotinamide riboside transporter PnuC n=1 Tax=Blattabacterium cuenoti TaxID=1653831 RepID=UPI00163C7908|nr:nicotinamide riboside transporter PnuC [Blattabacterium cuenoti]
MFFFNYDIDILISSYYTNYTNYTNYTKGSLKEFFLEIIAVILTIISVLFSQRNNVLVFPVGILGTTIYSYLTFITSLYGDFIINIYYTIVSLYGWFLWKKKENKKIRITYCNTKDYFYTSILFFFTCIFSVIVYYLNGKLKSYSDWMDIFTTGIYFSGMYQMSIKKVENWIFWMIGNIISVPLYFLKGLILTGILFIILFLLSIDGFIIWKKKAINSIF